MFINKFILPAAGASLVAIALLTAQPLQRLPDVSRDL